MSKLGDFLDAAAAAAGSGMAMQRMMQKNALSDDELTRRITDGVPGKFAKAQDPMAWAPSALDTQEGGDHYKDMKIQPVEFITANDMDFLQGNVVKYIARHKAKNGAQDVRKALHYCQLILELQYGEKPMNGS